jgi:hypothetical protein
MTCVSTAKVRPTSRSDSIARRDKDKSNSHFVSANGDTFLLFLLYLCMSCCSKASENVALKSQDGRFLSGKTTRMTRKKHEKYGALLKLRTNSVHFVSVYKEKYCIYNNQRAL